MHQARAEVGRRREVRLVELLRDYLNHAKHHPPWMHNVELASEEQDIQGIDVVVKTDVGDLFIQVKSSERFRYMFVTKGWRQWKMGRAIPITGIVIVNDGRPNQKILGESLREINRLRQTVQLHGSNYMPGRTAMPWSTS
ncbi:MAG: hypothetical protein HY420_02535 [Candidatus Kerfeldbacteria bacterium]|nr:hypothetical protein [Candidatus Kerfeldbacteria bacterium]